MSIILDDDKKYIICEGPQIGADIYNIILIDSNKPSLKKEEKNGI